MAISIRKDGNQYRIIVRTSELLTLRGSVPEEALGGIRPQGRPPTRELLELVAPEVQLGCLRSGTAAAEEALARLDEQGLSNKYKVGVLYCRSGQRTEEEMYNNQHAGPAFLEFLDTIGQRIRLRGFEGYKAGLDTRTDSTGTHAVAATYRGAEVTFHVSTMLPFTPNNRQQLLRKRHIGNDIVTIVFQVENEPPLTTIVTYFCYLLLFLQNSICFVFRSLARCLSARGGYALSFNTFSSWSGPWTRALTTLSTEWRYRGAKKYQFSDRRSLRPPPSPRGKRSPISSWRK